jgi:hypothetical protein
MHHSGRWMRVILTAAALLAVSAGELTPGRSETVEDAPHPEEIRLLEELAAWTGDPALPGYVGERQDLPFPQDESMTSSVRERAESFEVFAGMAVPREARRELLSRLPYADEIERAARAHQLDPFLVAAMVEAESSFRPLVASHKGAVGLMQLMPGTALEMGVEDPQQPRANLEAGTRYLKRLLRRYDGDIVLALAAYNAGPTQVRRFGGVPPFPETTRYVEKVLRLYVGHRRKAWRAEATEQEPTPQPAPIALVAAR